ncbi:MAG: glycerol-3-phosphate dehydrogenase/oxidase [Micromonosporaceae bacterium]
MPPTTTTSLNAARRRRELGALADGEVVDVLVVGLGATGAGAALDAASRGLSVAALDAHDLAFGTSRWSSKLIHGGLRYLANLDVATAFECAHERGILLDHTAPHLTRPLPVLLPLRPDLPDGVVRLHRAGILAGDVLRRLAGTSAATLPRARRLPVGPTLRLAPGLRPDDLRGAHLNWDGQLEDDARLVVAIARTAAGLGAKILTRCRVTTLAGDGAVVRDEIAGTELTVRARCVINAAGVWAGQLVPDLRLRPSRGTHLLLRRELVGGLDAELTVPVPGHRARYVIAVPQPSGLVLVGITDEPVDGPVEDVPTPPESDIAFLLDVLGSALAAPPRRTDVIGAFAGLRPLLDDGRGRSADVSRRHAVHVGRDGVVTVVGGKLTTYRRMAQDAVTAALRRAGLAAGPSRTKRLPLVGAAPRARLARLARPDEAHHLVRRYGTEATDVVALSTEDGSLADPLVPGVETTGAELVWALRHEGALDVDDLLDRRTRIGLVPADRAAARPAAEAILAAYG